MITLIKNIAGKIVGYAKGGRITPKGFEADEIFFQNLEAEVGEGKARVNDFELTVGEGKAEAVQFHVDSLLEHSACAVSQLENNITHHVKEKK